MKRLFSVLIALLFISPVFAVPEIVEDAEFDEKCKVLCDDLNEEPQKCFKCYDINDIFSLVSPNMENWEKLITIPADEYSEDIFPMVVVICKNKTTSHYSGLLFMFEGYKLHLIRAAL